ncbi:formate hydrogenlyase subunit 3 [Salmonella enterica subsp. arizonae]|uniref:Formate hydrogenlyase subunit 3 n=1 Tax=Salmonella enterica subsp. arizonae TaxID=59203 RepID=A0A2X4TH82_SALER|nr:formate hydrogenlyase subunit 3 [Salmonella enterica subsp. arizonae]
MAEIMALCAVFLTGGSKEGKLWFALGRLGTLLLAIACGLAWQRYGTLDMGLLDQRAQQLPLGSDIWLLGVIGFGLLAGIIRYTAGCRRRTPTPALPPPRCSRP